MHANEIKYFEEILRTRRAQIIQNITSVEAELVQLQQMELNDEGDYAAASNDNIVENAIGMQQEQELREIEEALVRIGDGSYGSCEMCDDDIGIHRLKVKPHARYCIVCREIIEKNRQ
ncbi:MAG: molecular chaperone DnaK [Sulfuricurvum sp. PC08-66]|nr:MAG: molecular chaperone DnaK [Sulfuricurvum sp. PC08-66]